MIGIKPLFSGRSLADGASANFDVIVAAPDGKALAQSGLHYQLLRIDTHYQYYKRDGAWNFEPVKTTTRVADGAIDTTPDKPGRVSLPVNFGRYRLDVSTSDPNGPRDLGRLRRRLVCRSQCRHARHARSGARQAANTVPAIP